MVRVPIKIAISIAAAVAALCPFPTDTVPEWQVQFLDSKGSPFANLPVQQTWQNYSVESKGNYMTLQTNREGFVTFPAHVVWSPMLVRLLHPIGNVVSTGVHASFGASSWLVPQCDVLASGDRSDAYTGSELPKKILLKYFDRSGIRAAMPGMMVVPKECAAIEAQAKNADA